MENSQNISGLGRLNILFSSFNGLEDKYNTKNTLISAFLIFLLFLNFLLLGINHINENTNPEEVDTTSFLGEANLIKNKGGITSFLRLCINGKYKQANQHPLYILILSLFASKEISFFINAKITSMIIGFLLLAIVFFIVKNKYGDLCASIAVFGMLLNATFIKWTTLVACESMIMLASVLCIFFILEGFKNNKMWLFAGMFAGLAFMTKGTGLFLIPGFLVSSLYIYKFSIFKNKYFYSFFILLIVVASPLIIRNVVAYKNPIYNINTAKLSYTKEQIEESGYMLFNPDVGAGIIVYPEVNLENSKNKLYGTNRFNLRRFAKKNVLKIVIETRVFLKALSIWPLKHLFSKKIIEIVSLIFFSFFVIGLIREKKAGKVYLISTIMVFLISLTLFRPLPRYFLPIIPFVWIYIAVGVFTFIDISVKYLSSKIVINNALFYTSCIIAAVFMLTLSYIGFTQPILNPLNSVEYSNSRYDLLNWLRNNLKENDTYVEGPNFNWQLDKGTWILPPRNSRLELTKYNLFAKRFGIDYIILDWYSLTESRFRGGGINKLKKIEGYFELNPTHGIVQKKKVDSWKLIYKDPREKVEFMVFKII